MDTENSYSQLQLALRSVYCLYVLFNCNFYLLRELIRNLLSCIYSLIAANRIMLF